MSNLRSEGNVGIGTTDPQGLFEVGAGTLTVKSNGNVGIGTTSPQSTLQVNGYVQLALTSGAPAGTDCDEAAEEGRMKFDPAADLLYICSGVSGWVAK